MVICLNVTTSQNTHCYLSLFFEQSLMSFETRTLLCYKLLNHICL